MENGGYMKLKLLFLALLTGFAPAILAMEKPLAPEIKAEDKNLLKIIDIEKKHFVLSRDLSQALLKCTNLDIYKLHAGILDFTGLDPKARPFLTQGDIRLLALFIINPKCIERDELAPKIKQLDFFELAHYLGAPDNILYLLANETWPLMQDQKDDTDAIKAYKKSLRQAARPHFASPKHLAEYIKAYSKNCYFDWARSHNVDYSNLSFESISGGLENKGWYLDKNNNWYKVYPFCTLDGIKDLYESYIPAELHVSGHRLATVSGNLLGNNSVYNIEIYLDDNPITSIDDSFFQALAKKRAAGQRVEISLMNTKLTAEQKEEFNKKFYNATNTLPQRYLNKSKFRCLATGAACLGTALAVQYFSYKLPGLIRASSVVSTGIVGFVAGGVTGCLTGFPPLMFLSACYGLFAAPDSFLESLKNNPKILSLPTHLFAIPLAGLATKMFAADYAALALAKRSHPDISWKAEKDIVWNKNYTLKI